MNDFIYGKYKIKIIYEDNHLLVVNKPNNIPTQKDSSNDIDMLNALKYYLKNKYNKPGNVFLGLLHRLDRPVSGIMVFAKTSKAASRISEQIRNKAFYKEYYAILNGYLSENEGKLVDYLYKDRIKNIVRIVKKNHEEAKEAILKYKLIKKKKSINLVSITLITGRPHQIRAQFANYGNSICGDKKYGIKEDNIKNICLISKRVEFLHPTTKEKLEFTCSLPKTYPWNIFNNV